MTITTNAQALFTALPAMIKGQKDPISKYSEEFLLAVIAYLMGKPNVPISKEGVDEFLHFVLTFTASGTERVAICMIRIPSPDIFVSKLWTSTKTTP